MFGKHIVTLLLLLSALRASDSLEITQVNKIFSPVLTSMASKDYSTFLDWFTRHSTVNDAIRKQMEMYIENMVKVKIAIYGKVIETRLVKNVIINNKYGTVVFIQDYEHLFVIWRFNYYMTNRGDISLKGFSVDSDVDTSDLFNGRLSSIGIVLDTKQSEFVP